MSALFDLVACIVGVTLIVWLLGVFGPQLDERDVVEIRAAQAFDRDMQAAKDCREQHGESLVVWNNAGDPVCVPRGYIHRKNQVATR